MMAGGKATRWMRLALAGAALVVAVLVGWVWLAPRSGGSDGVRPMPGDAAESRGLNVVLVLVDALRADRLGAYGHPGGLTPEIDALAEQALVFTDAHANAPSTVRSVASLFTSTLPPVHRVSAPPGQGDELHLSALPEEMLLAPEHFQRFGYTTIMVTGKGWITPEVNYDQGVNEYVLLDDRADRNMVAAAVEALERRRERPFFLYLHLLDLHDYYHSEVLFERHADIASSASPRLQELRGRSPGEIYDALYTAPESFTQEDVELLSRVYDRELARTDAELGRLVDALGALDLLGDTLIVLTSDHGEQFGEHGLLGHGGDGFHDEVLRIPFLVAGPGLFEARRDVEDTVGSVDFIPTIADLVGLEPATEWQGHSPLAGTGSRSEDRPVIATNRRTWKLLTPAWAYIYSSRYDREELYDRRVDPGERIDLAAERPTEVARFRELLESALAGAREHPYVSLRGNEVRVSEEVEDTLRSLGYIR